VGAYCWGAGSPLERVKEANGVCLSRKCADLACCCPAELSDLVIGGEFSADGVASKYHGDNMAWHVVIDSRQRAGLYLEAGFFVDLAAKAVFDGLAVFQDSARRFPAAVIAALDQQYAVAVDDGTSDAGRIWVLAHGLYRTLA